MIVKNITDEIFDKEINEQTASKHIILTSNNEDANSLNDKVLEKIRGEEMIYSSADSIVSDDDTMISNFTIEFINQQQASGMPPHNLRLKKVAIVMLLGNLNPGNGLLNDTRLIVEKITKT